MAISTLGWIAVGVLAWLAVAMVVGVLVGGTIRRRDRQVPRSGPVGVPAENPAAEPDGASAGRVRHRGGRPG